jgi:hypothetical protein
MKAAAIALAACLPGIAASVGNLGSVPSQMVVTVLPDKAGNRPANLQTGDVQILEGNTAAPVVHVQKMAGGFADMQLFILLDDSTRPASLGVHLPDLKRFIESLPATTQVAIGYMRNGSVASPQAFTADHQQAANAARLPQGQAGVNGSPYFALADLVKHWPSKEPAGRRAVLMFTDGVDRYYGDATVDDPYLDAAIHDALRNGVMVYSIYLRGAGLYGHRGLVRDFAQSRLMQVSEETGGHAYFEVFTDPVTIEPFLKDLQDRFENQYLVDFQALDEKSVQPVKLRTELPGVKIEGPTRVAVR